MRVARLLCALSFLLSTLPAQVSTWTGAIDSDWSNPANWNPQTVPDAGIDAVIAMVPNPASTNGVASPTCRDLTVATGAVLDLAPGFPLTVQGSSSLTGSITGGGLMICAGIGTIAAPGSNPYANIDVQGNYAFSGDVAISDDLQQLAGAGSLGFAGGRILVGGNASFAGGGVADSGASTLDVEGDLSFATTIAVTVPPSRIFARGDWVSNANFTPNSGLVTFGGSSPQVISGASGITWSDLSIIDTTVTTDLSIDVTGALLVQAVLTTTGTEIQVGGDCRLLSAGFGASGVFGDNILTMSVGGDLTVQAETRLPIGVLDISGNATLFFATMEIGPGTHRFAGDFTATFLTLIINGTATFSFDGSGEVISSAALPDVDIAGTYTLRNIPIAGALHHLMGAGVLGFDGNVTVNGNGLFEGQSMLDTSIIGSTLSILGDASMQTTALVDTPPQNIIVGGNWDSNSNWAPTTGTVTLTNPQPTVTATVFSTTSVSVGSGSQTTLNITQSLSVTGTMTVQGTYTAPPVSLSITGTLALPSPSTILQLSPGSNQVAGNVTNNGTITGAGVLTMTGTGTISGSGSFGNLAINSTGTVTASNITGSIDGTFELLAGVFQLAPSSVVQVGGASTFAGGSVSGDSSSTLDLDQNADWQGTTAGASMPTITVAGDWTADENFAPTSGTVILDGGADFISLLSSSVEGGSLHFHDLVISGDVAAGTDMLLDVPTMTITSGGAFGIGTAVMDNGLDLDGNSLTFGGGQMNIDGLLEIDRAELCLELGSVVNVGTGSTLRMSGTPNLPATICGPPCGNYQVNIAGTLEAVNFQFLDMGPTGIRLLDGISFGATPFDMRAGLFAEGAPGPGSVQLSIETSMDMDFSDITFTRTLVDMPEFNVRSSSTTGQISFTNFAGNFAGDVWEDDPFDVIDWPGEVRTNLRTAKATSAVGKISIHFTTRREIDAASMHVMRATNPAGPFTEISGATTALGSETSGASYRFTDSAVIHPRRYHYRIEEELVFFKRRMLAELSAISWPFHIGDSVFVGNGGLRTIAEGIAAVPIGGNVIVAAGNYPGFTIDKPVHILSDGTGPVWIETHFSKLIVRDIGAGSSDLAFYDLNIGPADAEGIGGMEIINCDNVIILDRVMISSGSGFIALQIDDCPQVALQDCTLLGGTALHVLSNSTVAVSGGTITSMRVEDTSTVTHLDTGISPLLINKDLTATVTALSGSVARLEFPMLWPTNTTQTLEIEANAGDTWMLLQGVSKDFMDITPYMPSELYLLLTLGTLTTPDMGIVGGTGTAQAQIVIPDMPELWGMDTPYQLLIQDSSSGVFRFANVRDQVFVPN